MTLTLPRSIRLSPEPAAALHSLSVEELAQRAECEIDTAALVIERRLTCVPDWMVPVADELHEEQRQWGGIWGQIPGSPPGGATYHRAGT